MTPAKAQTTQFTTGGTYTATEGNGGVLNAVATQVNSASLLSSNIGTQQASTVTVVTVTATGSFPPGPRNVNIDSSITTNVAGGGVTLDIALGAASAATAAIESNAVVAYTTGSAATRTLDLDQVTGASATALLGLRQTNDGSTATAQIGVLPGTGLPVETYSGATANAAQWAQLTSLTGSFTGTGVQTTTNTSATPQFTSLLINGSTATNATASVGSNTVEARVLFNSATQDAIGSAGNLATTGSASATIGMLAAGPPVANSVSVSSPVSVASDQLNNQVNATRTAADPTAVAYNTNIGVALTGVATTTTAQVTDNEVAARLAGNAATNRGTLEGDASAYFNTGFAVTTVQGNNAPGVLGSLVQNTNIGVQSGVLDVNETFGGNFNPAGAVSFGGTANVSGNAVATSSVGNSASASLSNTLATALDGNYVRTGNNVNLSAAIGTTSTVASDLQVVTGQANASTALLSQTLDTQIAVLANVSGTALVQDNAVTAASTLNEAANSLGAVRGTGVTAASAVVQRNDGSYAQAEVFGADIRTTGTLSNSTATLTVTGNQVGATSVFNTASQDMSAATDQSVGGLTSALASVNAGVDAVVGAQLSVTSLQRNQNIGPGAARPNQELALVDSVNITGTVTGATPGPLVTAAPITITVSSNTIVGSVLANEVSNALTLGSAALTQASGIAVVASQANTTFTRDLDALVNDANIEAVVPFSAVFMTGTATVNSNVVSASAVGNSASNSVANTLATALTGSYSRSGNNAPTVTPNAVGTNDVATLAGDLLMVIAQGNESLTARATTEDTNIEVQGNLVGTATVSGNLQRALTTLNQAEQSLTAVRGQALTSAVVTTQFNNLVNGFATTDDVEVFITGVETGSGSTLSLTNNQSVAGVTLNTVAQSVRAASTQAAGSAVNASVSMTPGSITAGAQLLLGSAQVNAGSQATAVNDDTDIEVRMEQVGTGLPTVTNTGNRVVASGLGSGATNAVTLADAALIDMSGIAVTTTQRNEASGLTRSLVSAEIDSVDIRISSLDAGTGTLSGNTALASATGNSAAASVANSLGVALSGNFIRGVAPATGEVDNVTVALTGATGPGITAAGDIVVATSQRNLSTTVQATNTDTPEIVFSGNFRGTATVDSNAVGAVATLNTASNGLTVIGGAGVTAAGVLSQRNGSLTAGEGASAQSNVDNAAIHMTGVESANGSTASVTRNEIAAATTLNRGVQTATASLTQGAGTSVAARVMLDTGTVGVGAQLQLTTTQTNEGVNVGTMPFGAGSSAAQVIDSSVRLELLNSALTPTATTLTLSSNRITASVMGNDATATAVFDTSAANTVDGAAVATVQANVSLGNMAALSDNNDVQMTLGDGVGAGNNLAFNGTASVGSNVVASSSVANRSANGLSNAMGTLSGGFSPATATTPSITVNALSQQIATGDFVVFNSQANDAVNASATTRLTEIGVDINANLTTGTTVSVASNRVTAAAALNETTNTLTLVQGDGIVGSLFSNQANSMALGATSARASVSDTLISPTTSSVGALPGSTVVTNNNTVAAGASGNVASNTISNNGLSSGGIYATAGTALNTGGVPLATYGDYVVANRQLNTGTSAAAPLVIGAEVLNTSIRMTGTLTGSTSQMNGNVVLASAMGNQASNRVGVTGLSSASMGEASFQSNQFASITSSVQSASLTMAPLAAGNQTGSTMLMLGNTVGAVSTGNMLTSVIGR